MRANPTPHPALARIYQALKAINVLSGDNPSDLARLLNETPQTITNWGKRATGPSDAGALEIQRRFWVNANWIKNAEGPMLIAPADNLDEAYRSAEPKEVSTVCDTPAAYTSVNPAKRLNDTEIPGYYADRFGELSEHGRVWVLAKLDEALKEAADMYSAPPEKRRHHTGR